jgi:enamine deaminase RidA (YjgF/YER057c/UK114 family)
MDDLVDCTIFLGNMSDYAALNTVWATAFRSPPARAAFGAGLCDRAQIS